jgi:hypothetical protein
MLDYFFQESLIDQNLDRITTKQIEKPNKKRKINNVMEDNEDETINIQNEDNDISTMDEKEVFKLINFSI